MSSFIDRVRAAMTGSLNRPAFTAPKPKVKSHDIINLNRWDQRAWDKARQQPVVNDLISDLLNGDEHMGGNRAAFDAAPELAKSVWASLYKADPQMTPRGAVHSDAYPAWSIVKGLRDNERLTELHEVTIADATMATVGLDAMGDVLREVLTTMPTPPPPPPSAGEDGEPEPGDGGGQPQPKKGKPQGGDEQDEPGDEQGDSDDEGNDEGEADGGDSGDGEDGGEDGDGEPQQAKRPGEQGDDEGDDEGGDEGGEPGDGEAEPGENEAEGEGDGAEFEPDTAAERAEADWQDAFDKLLDDVDLDRALGKALSAATDAAEELDAQRRGIGIEDGEWQQMSPEERLVMAQRLATPQMKALADMVGRMKRFALGVRATRITDVAHEPYDVHNGNELRHLLKAEYALLATRETSYEFFRRYADKELLQYKLRGTEDAGKGPIVMVIDKSGSMDGDPFRWAMGVSEALRRFAAEDGRDFVAFFFGNNDDRNRFDFPKGSGPFEKVLTFLSVRADGGTQFDGVLTEALSVASAAFDGDSKGKADIVFITDGQAHLGDSWINGFNAERERAGVRVFGVQIGGAHDYYGGQGRANVLDKVCDAVINVNDLRPEAVGTVFTHI